MAYSYTKTQWEAGWAITAQRMMNIENGIAGAITDASNAASLAQSATSTAQSAAQTASTAQGIAQSAYTAIDNVQSDISHGSDAWEQIVAAVGGYKQDGVTLKQSLATLVAPITQHGTDILSLSGAISAATNINGGNDAVTVAQSLADRITILYNEINIAKQGASSVASYFSSTNKTNVLERLNAIDENPQSQASMLAKRSLVKVDNELKGAYTSHIYIDPTTNNLKTYEAINERFNDIEDHFKVIEDEVNAAHSSSAFGTNPQKIDTRFENIESEIKAARGNNSSTATLTNRLDAIDKMSVTGSLINSINRNTSDISTLNTDLNTLSGTVSEINSQINVGSNSLATQIANAKTRLDNIDNGTNSMISGINQDITDIQDAIGSGTPSNTIYQRLTSLETSVDTTNTGLLDRMTAAEGKLNTVGDLSSGLIQGLDARLDALDGGSASNISISDLDSRIGAVTTNIGDANSGLTQRVGTLETTVGNSNAGLVKDVNTLKTQVGDNNNGLIHDVAGLSTNVGNLTTAVGDNNSGLTARVLALETEPKSATVIYFENQITYDAETGDPTLYPNSNKTAGTEITPTTDADYLLQDGDKYYYWKYIQTGNNYEWQKISGSGGGTGSSSGAFAATLEAITAPNENTDYFVGNNTIGYTHYRYNAPANENESGEFIRILPKNLINSIGVNSVTLNTNVSSSDEWPNTTTSFSGGLNAYAVGDDGHTTNLLNDFVAVRNTRINAVYDGDELKSQTLEVLDTKGNLISYPIVGGSGGSAYSIRMVSTLPNNTFSVPSDDSYRTNVSAQITVKQGNELLTGVTFSGEVLYKLSTNTEDNWRSSTIVLPSITNGSPFNVDVSAVLASNTTTIVRLQVLINTGDGEPVTRYVDYTITKTQIAISSTFNPARVINTPNLIFPYKCQGVNLTKTVHFQIDGVDAITPITTSTNNQVLEAAIPVSQLSNGAHTLSVYFTAGTVSSNVLNYYIIYNLDATRKEPIVGMAAETSSITYGDELIVNYTVYTPGKERTDKVEIQLYTLDNNNNPVIFEDRIDTLENVPIEASQWKAIRYPMPITPEENQPEEPVTVYVKITAYYYEQILVDEGLETEHTEINTYSNFQTTSVIINRFTNPNNYDFTEINSRNILYSFNPYGKTNHDIGKEEYNYIYTANDVNQTPITFHGRFNNFNWATNGYDGESLIISGGATHTIDVPIFSSAYNGISLEAQSSNDITEYGRTIEIDYEVRSATNLNATIIDCMDPDTHAGFRITPSCCYLTNQTTPADIEEGTGFILNESSIAAAYLQTNTRMHLVFVIEPWSTEKAFDNKYHQSVNIYINGEYANSCPYTRDSSGNIIDSFSTNATMSIGSDTCILKIYGIRLYNRGLNHQDVLQLYKMAPNVLYDKVTRFADNDILDDEGNVSYEKARKRYNCLLLIGPDPTDPNTLDYPTISPYKGYKSPAKRKKKASATEYEGKTESGIVFSKPSNDPTTAGYVNEFELKDKVPAGAEAYLGTEGAYCSSNNVQGTSSQKYPLHNLKIYLATWQPPKEAVYTEDPDTHEQVLVSAAEPGAIKKYKYCLKGKDSNGNPLGTEESTFCWKADYMSTDHANTYNANIADGLFTDELQPGWKDKKYQNTVYGVRCLLFQQQGDEATPVFVGDGCLNNDKGNTKTFGLEYTNKTNPELSDNGVDTLRQKWEFTNNTSPLNVFKSDNLFGINESDSKRQMYAAGAFECSYPDEGDLTEDGLTPNYNHLQLLLTWVNKRACYLDYSVYDDVNKTTTYYTVSDTEGTGDTYNGVNYSTERELKKAIFKNEFEEHFNLNHVLTYYLFSEYVALCDNRAKNMFLRSEDIRSEVIYDRNGNMILNGNEYPDDGTLWNTFVHATGENAGITHPDVINWSTTGTNHSTFAKWAPVLYDLDSCFGLENIGLITIRYDADWQYKYNNKEAFSGFDSVFWLMVEDTYADELRALATGLYNNELNFTNFYRQQITGNKNSICPAITNQDMILKYEQPWNEGFINYAETPDEVTGEYPRQTPEYKYIQRGTRFTQKTTFMRQRSMLLSSRYVANEFTNSMISFRAGKLVTGTDTQLTLTANQELYPAIMFGDSNTLVKSTELADGTPTVDGRVPANTPCHISTTQIGNSDTVKIVGASVLTDIGDISKYQPYELKVGAGTNLKKLIIGSNANGYINTSTESIEGLSSCAILEEINVRNLTKLTSLNLSGNGLIKKVYAGGSNITTISLPNGGVLQEVEYGANTSNITLLNQTFFTTFTYENSQSNHYANLKKLWIENTPNVPVVDIINTAMAGLDSGVRLVGIDIDLYPVNGTEQENLAALNTTTLFLNTLVNDLAIGKYLDSNGSFIPNNNQRPYISGKVHITSIRTSLLDKLHEYYPDLIIYDRFDSNNNPLNNPITEFTILYLDENGDEDHPLYIDYRTNEEYFIDPVKDLDPITNQPYREMPTKDEDAEYKYWFGTYTTSIQSEYNYQTYNKYSGWLYRGTNIHPNGTTKVNGDTVFIANYNDTKQKQRYLVKWYDEANHVKKSVEAEYGDDLSGLTPPEKEDPTWTINVSGTTTKVFKGWSCPVGKITHDVDVYALWETSTINSNTTSIDMENLNAADIYALSRLQHKDDLLKSKLGSTINIKLGHDFEYTDGTSVINLLSDDSPIILNHNELGNIRVYDGTNNMPEIRPLSLNSDWTLAIDYKFLMKDKAILDSMNEFVLASCYFNDEDLSANPIVPSSTIIGFKVSLVKQQTNVHQIVVSWGDQSVTIDYVNTDYPTNSNDSIYFHSYRNVVVLSHNSNTADRNNLRVTYVNPRIITGTPYGANYGLNVTNTLLSYNNIGPINTPLILGGNYRASSSEFENYNTTRRPADGIIYWAKYWNVCLGESDCMALAAWPHETVAFYLTGYNDTNIDRVESIYGKGSDSDLDYDTQLSFAAAQGVGDKYIYTNRTANGSFDSQGYYGWHMSWARNICNNLIYNGMPTAYQTIINNYKLRSYARNPSLTNGSTIMITRDYLFLSSHQEIADNATFRNEINTSWTPPFHWMTARSNVYEFSEGSTQLLVNKTLSVNDIQYYLYRFSEKCFNNQNRIFVLNRDPSNISNLSMPDGSRAIMQSGDVWVDNNSESPNYNVAFIYISASEIENGASITMREAGNRSGGWRQATYWNLRTYLQNGTTPNENLFYRISPKGVLTTPQNSSDYGSRILCPEFVIK